MDSSCEAIRGNGTTCGDTAVWVISVGERKTDQQLSCEVHLDETCRTIYEAEGRLSVVLHVKSTVTVMDIDKRKMEVGGTGERGNDDS